MKLTYSTGIVLIVVAILVALAQARKLSESSTDPDAQ